MICGFILQKAHKFVKNKILAHKKKDYENDIGRDDLETLMTKKKFLGRFQMTTSNLKDVKNFIF